MLNICLCQTIIGVLFKHLNCLSNLYSIDHGHIISTIQCNTHNETLHMSTDLDLKVRDMNKRGLYIVLHMLSV